MIELEEYEPEPIYIILPLRYVPDGWTVYKEKGSTPLTHKTKLVLYVEGSENVPVTYPDEMSGLVSERGTINLVSIHKLVKVEFEEFQQAISFLEDCEQQDYVPQ